MIAAIGDGSDFKNGRHLAAWLSWYRASIRVAWQPRSNDGYQQARQSALENTSRTCCTGSCPHGSEKNDSRSMWANEFRQRRGYNRATVAVANKNARVIRAVLTSGESYRAAA